MLASKVVTVSSISCTRRGNLSVNPKAFIVKDSSRLSVIFQVMFSIPGLVQSFVLESNLRLCVIKQSCDYLL